MLDMKLAEDLLDQTEITFKNPAIVTNRNTQAPDIPARTPICVRFILADGVKLDVVVQPLRFITLGRCNTNSNGSIDIDFAPYAGRTMGVSRHHATVLIRKTDILIKDQHSRNGTFLNGEKLAPMQEYALHNGDAIALGSVGVIVNFIY
jgi:hypothetical protein